MMGHVEGRGALNDPIDGVIDEINMYLDAYYVSALEACWKTYECDIHEGKLAIQRLQIPSYANSVIF